MTLTVALVYPELLGTYGDRGNGVVLVERARWRGIDAALVEVGAGDPLPEADVYCLGGGEDGPERRAAECLLADGALTRALGRGAAVLGVCGGYQILGHEFPAADGRAVPGLGLLDVTTRKGTGPRAVGELLAEPVASLGDGVPVLTGFENHAGVTALGGGAAPLARVVVGVGNGDGDEGAFQGRVLGTYLHGPLLARNPAIADLLLSWATGGSLTPVDDTEIEALRAERVAAARSGARGARLLTAARTRSGLGRRRR